MDISNKLIKDFVNNLSNDEKKEPVELYGYIQKIGDNDLYVMLDGSDEPILADNLNNSVEYFVNDRVKVQIKDHKATIVSNFSNESVGRSTADRIDEKATEAKNNVDELNTIIGDPDNPASGTLYKRVNDAERNITTIETDITSLDGRVQTAEGSIATIETDIGDPSDAASASGSLYARVKNVKNVADGAVNDINAEVIRAQAAEQHAEQAAQSAVTAAGNATTAAASAVTAAASASLAASNAQAASEAAIEANYRKYNAITMTQSDIDTKCAHGYSGSWARASADGYYQDACAVGDVLIIYVTKPDSSVGKLLVRVTTASAAGQDTTGETISWDNNVNAYFWHDSNGAHIIDAKGSAGSYRTDIKSNGLEIVDIASNKPVATFGANKIELGKNSVSAEIKLCGDRGCIDNKPNYWGHVTAFYGGDQTAVGEWDGASEAYALFRQGFSYIGCRNAYSKYEYDDGDSLMTMRADEITIDAALLGVDVKADMNIRSGYSLTVGGVAVSLNGHQHVGHSHTANYDTNDSDTTSQFVIEHHNHSYSNYSGDVTLTWNTTTWTKSGGYYPIGIVGFDLGKVNMRARSINISNRAIGSCKINCIVRTTGSGQSGTAGFDILWVKI